MNLINVKNLYQAEVGTTESFDIEIDLEGLDFPEEIEIHKVTGRLKVMLLEDSVTTNGTFEVDITLICDRCLDSFETKINFTLDREFFFDRKEMDKEKLYVDKYQNINISDPVREEIIMAIPIQNFCMVNCPGICPTCGENLNKEACKCNNKKTDIEEK